MERYISRLDRFAKPLTLNYKGSSVIGTLPGAILTIGAYLLVFIFLCQQSIIYNSEDEEIISSYVAHRPTKDASFNFMDQRIQIGFKVIDINTNEIIDLDPADGRIQFNSVMMNQTGFNETILEAEKLTSDESTLLNQTTIVTEASFQGSISDLESTLLTLNIYGCNNETLADNKTCSNITDPEL